MPTLSELFNLDPKVERLALMPRLRGSLGSDYGVSPEMQNSVMFEGKKGFMPDVIAPKVLYDFIRAIKAPGRAARGEVLDEEEALNTAMNVMGGGMATSGGAPAGSLGMFIGPKSQSWNWKNLGKAQELETSGVPVSEIFRKTKTARLPSGEWVQEISDKPAKMSRKELKSTYYPEAGRYAEGFKVSDVLEHPELFKAYPQVGQISGSFKSGVSSSDVASYSPGANWISYNEKVFRKPFMTPERQAKIDAARKEAKDFEESQRVKDYDKFWEENESLFTKDRDQADKIYKEMGGPEIETTRSNLWKTAKQIENTPDTIAGAPRMMLDSPRAKGTTLHEISHAIEDLEGFPRGGTPSGMGKILQEEAFRKIETAHDPLLARFNELRTQYLNDPNPPKAVQKEVTNLKRRIKELQDQARILTEQKKNFGSTGMFDEKQLYDAYHRLQGEAVARLVERRAELGPAEQGKFFPFEKKSEANPYGLDVDPKELLMVKGDNIVDPLTQFLQTDRARNDPLMQFLGYK